MIKSIGRSDTFDFFAHCDAYGRAKNGSPERDAVCTKELNTILEERMGDTIKDRYCATLFHKSNRDFGM